MQHACAPCVHSRVGGRDEGHVMSHSGATETGLLGKLKTSLLKKQNKKLIAHALQQLPTGTRQ